MLARLVGLILTAILAAAGLWLGSLSFSKIHEMRQLERVPRCQVHSVLPGEVNLAGRVQFGSERLTSPDTGTACVYYSYKVEEKRRKSGGGTRWSTIKSETRSAPDFLLQDPTGTIIVRQAAGDPDYELKLSHQRTEGKRRYSESRIDPGDELFVFGFAERGAGDLEVRFDRPGDYTPILSKQGESSERVEMAFGSVLACWGGLFALALAVLAACRSLGVHRVLVFLSLLTLVLTATLVWFGLRMMESDLQSGAERLQRHEQAAREVVSEAIPGWNGDWNTLDAGTNERVGRIALDLGEAAARYRAQLQTAPERWLKGGWDLPAAPDVPEPPGFVFERARLPSGAAWAAGLGGLALTALFFWLGYRYVKVKRTIENVPTSKTGGVVYGLCEVQGTIELEEGTDALRGPLSERDCVYFHYWKKERVGSGKNAKWVTREELDRSHVFLCRDEEGVLPVNPMGAEIITHHKDQDRQGSWLYIEHRLEVGDPLYAIGHSGIDPRTSDSLQMRRGDDDIPLLVANDPEDKVMRGKAFAGMLHLTLAFSVVLLAALILFGGSGGFAATDYLASALAAPLLLLILMILIHYNDLAFLRRWVDRAWANIEVALKKRHDLIPRLETVAKAYLSHESGLQEKLAGLRGAYSGGVGINPTMLAQLPNLAGAFQGLTEDYPDLKGDQQAARLMKGLTDVENEIALMREGYNSAVQVYNTRIHSFPDVLLARIGGYRDRAFVK